MAILDIFKKKKKEEKKKEEPKKKEKIKLEKKEGKKREEKKTVSRKKEELKPEKPASTAKRERKTFFKQVLKEPHITEKATLLAEENFYVFKVFPKSNKNEVKKAVESIYGVDVLNVNMINIPRRERRVGKSLGWKKGYKKAVVKIKEGQKIEVAPR